MSGEQGWRTPVDAYDYLSHKQKQNDLADRRPVIRKAADLVGPGIGSQAVALADFNDLLATYNGYYAGVTAAANAPTNSEGYVGFTVMDANQGGVQTFTGMTSGRTYRRLFRRNPSDLDSIFFDAWKEVGAGVPIGVVVPFAGPAAPTGYLPCTGLGYSAATYPDLFAAIGYTYGGSGGTFILPDLRDRTIYGPGAQWGQGSTDGLSLGARNGRHTHVGSISQDSGHQHIIVADMSGNHSHSILPATMGKASNTTVGGSSDRLFSGESHDHSGSTGSDGLHGHLGTAQNGGVHAHTNTITETTPNMPGVGMLWVIKSQS